MLMVSDLLEVARGGRDATMPPRAVQRYASGTRPAPVIVWNVNRACNMSCPHCYAAARPEPVRGELSTAEGRALLGQLAAHGMRVVIFSGGEPLLRADLFDLLAHARSCGLSPHLSTNGTLIDAEVAARLRASGVGYVGISIDGLPAFNDDYRGLPGGFERALAGLRHAKAAGLRTGLRMTLTRANAGQLADLLEVAAAAACDRFYVSHLVYAGRGFRMSGDDLRPEQSRALLWTLFGQAEALLDAGAALRIVTGANDSDGPLLLTWVRERHGPAAAARVEALLRRRGGNSAGESILNIDARGKVHPDQFWQRAVLGDVREDSWAEILAHPLRTQLRQRRRYLRGRCRACGFGALCRGSHRERALATGHGLWGADPACVMTDVEVGWKPTAQLATG